MPTNDNLLDQTADNDAVRRLAAEAEARRPGSAARLDRLAAYVLATGEILGKDHKTLRLWFLTLALSETAQHLDPVIDVHLQPDLARLAQAELPYQESLVFRQTCLVAEAFDAHATSHPTLPAEESIEAARQSAAPLVPLEIWQAFLKAQPLVTPLHFNA